MQERMTEKALSIRVAIDDNCAAISLGPGKVRIFDTTTGRYVGEASVDRPFSCTTTSVCIVDGTASKKVVCGTSTGQLVVYGLDSESRQHVLALGAAQSTATGLSGLNPQASRASQAVSVASMCPLRGTDSVLVSLSPSAALVGVNCGTGKVSHASKQSVGSDHGALWLIQQRSNELSVPATALATARLPAGKGSVGSSVLVLWGGSTSSVGVLDVLPDGSLGSLSEMKPVHTSGSRAPKSVWLNKNGTVAALLMDDQVAIVDVSNVMTGPADLATAARRLMRTLSVPSTALQFSVDEEAGRIAVSTVAGTVCVYDVKIGGASILKGSGKVAPVSTPVRPLATLRSTEVVGRLLCGSLSNSGLALLRGTWALPRVDGLDHSALSKEALELSGAGTDAAARAVGGASVSVPVPPSFRKGTSDDDPFGATPLVAALMHKSARKRAVQEAICGEGVAMVESAAAFSEAGVITRPTTDMQHLGSVSLSTQALSTSGTALTGIVIPLTQALHANDGSMVMELLDASHKNAVATISSLSRLFLVKLMYHLSCRTPTATIRSPLHMWITIALRVRGADLIPRPSDDAETAEAIKAARTALIPLLERYEGLTRIRDQVSFMYGRLSAFKAVRAESREKTGFLDTPAPVAFVEFKTRYFKAFRRLLRGKDGKSQRERLVTGKKRPRTVDLLPDEDINADELPSDDDVEAAALRPKKKVTVRTPEEEDERAMDTLEDGAGEGVDDGDSEDSDEEADEEDLEGGLDGSSADGSEGDEEGEESSEDDDGANNGAARVDDESDSGVEFDEELSNRE